MSRAETAHVLIVHPPAVSPAAPPPQMIRLARQTRTHGVSFEQYDANIEFYTRYLLEQRCLQQFLVQIEHKMTRGVYRTLDPESHRLLDDLAENRPQWERRIAAVGQCLAACRSGGFYQPEKSVKVLGEIATLLRLASLAFYPAQIRWDGFEHPLSDDPERLVAFSRDADSNPFQELCKTSLAPKLDRPALRLLLWVSVKSQLPAAVTMAVFSKQANPALHVAMASEPGLMAGCERFADSLMGRAEAESFFGLMRLDGEPPVAHNASEPDLSCLPSNRYLAPEMVLRVALKADGKSPDTVAYLIKNQAGCREEPGVRDLISDVDTDRCGYFSSLVGRAVSPKPAGGLALSTKLRESCRALDPDRLRQAGVNLIAWRDPEGSLEALKTVLWQVARAGIWNHLRVSADKNDRLTEALRLFAGANPNIVHSWETAQPAGWTADYFAEQEGPAVYGRVAKLPGKPLWHRLADPVHLLLYLARHGREKVMRWRVAGTGAKIYTLGSRLEFHYKQPAQLPVGYLDEICRMVADGGSVNMQHVQVNLARAFLIAYVLENGMIVGNSSLKNPRPEYIKTVNRQAGLDLTHYVERGYTSVRPEYRGMGIGARLLAGLTERAGDRKVFSVISEDNEAARTMAVRNQTREVAEYFSKRLGKRVGIWIPEWMLD